MTRTINVDSRDLHVKVDTELKTRMAAAAAADDRTLQSWLVRAIREKLERVASDDEMG
jgi:predicted HicB family RNase H-like nuclease